MNKVVSILFASGVVILTALFVWHAHRPVVAKTATWDDVIIEARDGGYQLITTEELAERYREDPESILLIDTRQEWEYRTGHIAGARNFPMEPTRWSRWRKADELETFLGPNKDGPFVFY